MAVELPAHQVQHGDREPAEDLLMERTDGVGCFDEIVVSQVVPVIADDPFLCVPTHLEMSETVISRFCPSQAEAPVSMIPAPSDCFPHDQVTRPEILKSPVRSPILVKDLITKRDVDVGRERCALQSSQNDKAHIPHKDTIVNALEEMPGLWGKAVIFPRQRIQTAESLQRIL
jgi:hypothetical protein